jgi:hypothetical protein
MDFLKAAYAPLACAGIDRLSNGLSQSHIRSLACAGIDRLSNGLSQSHIRSLACAGIDL